MRWRRCHDRFGAKSNQGELAIDVTGLDISSTAIATARQMANGLSNVGFQLRNVLAEQLPTGYDVIVCSLFLHHLSEKDAVGLLTRMHESGPRLVLVNDLRRSVLGYWLAQVACRTVARGRIVRVDGPRSVKGEFTIEEIKALCRRVGLRLATVKPKWPFRLLMISPAACQ